MRSDDTGPPITNLEELRNRVDDEFVDALWDVYALSAVGIGTLASHPDYGESRRAQRKVRGWLNLVKREAEGAPMATAPNPTRDPAILILAVALYESAARARTRPPVEFYVLSHARREEWILNASHYYNDHIRPPEDPSS